MPRVNRDLQRRLAARRERERRRPAERRYRFTTPDEAAPEVDEPTEALVDGDIEAEEADEAPPPAAPTRSRPAAPAAPANSSARRGAATGPAHKPFSAYRDEYRYVYSDLRRVGLVIGSLLVILVVLYFLLPLLIR